MLLIFLFLIYDENVILKFHKTIRWQYLEPVSFSRAQVIILNGGQEEASLVLEMVIMLCNRILKMREREKERERERERERQTDRR